MRPCHAHRTQPATGSLFLDCSCIGCAALRASCCVIIHMSAGYGAHEAGCCLLPLLSAARQTTLRRKILRRDATCYLISHTAAINVQVTAAIKMASISLRWLHGWQMPALHRCALTSRETASQKAPSGSATTARRFARYERPRRRCRALGMTWRRL